MRWLHERLASGRVMLLLLGVTLVTSSALCVLTWRVTVLDRALREQLASERLDQAAELGRSAILEQIRATSERLSVVLEALRESRPALLAQLAEVNEGRTAVLFQQRTLTLFPPRTLRYVPEASLASLVSHETFAAGEALEHGTRDYAAAAQWFRHLADQSAGPVRAGALLRLARNELKRKQPARALAAYDELARMESTTLDGEPAALIARHARLRVLTLSGRTAEAAALLRDLESGRWPISRTSYDYYRGELRAIPALETVPPVWEEAVHSLAAASEHVGVQSGARVVWMKDSQPALLIWRSRDGDAAAVAVTATYIARTWLAGQRGFTYGLETSDKRVLVPLAGAERQTERVLSFAGQDWRLLAAPTAPLIPQGTQSLRWVGLSLVIVLVLTGSYAVMRSVSRELAVARLQSDFVSAVSHEFRSPLTTLRSMSEMLERGRVPTEERKQRYYSLMARETGRLHKLVEDLLDFGRIEAGARVYDLQPMDIGAVVSQAVSDSQEEHAAAGFRITIVELQPALVFADLEGLRRALRNLLENAVKYSGDSRDIRVAVRSHGRHASISVEDAGMGISHDDLRRIFWKFERGADAKASSIAGTGLGLALVSAIMRAHGGTIQVESTLHRGSTFTLTLPCAAAADPRVACRAS